MSAKGFGFGSNDLLDDFIVSRIIDPRIAATLKPEEIEILRANIRSEILYSDQIREILVGKGQAVLRDMRDAKK